MTSACIHQGNHKSCPICQNCPFPIEQKIKEGMCMICGFHCREECPRFLDHQTVCNHNDSLCSYFAEIPVFVPLITEKWARDALKGDIAITVPEFYEEEDDDCP